MTANPEIYRKEVAQSSLDQIEEIAQGAGVSLISFRLSEDELNRLTSLQKSRQTAYSLAVIASEGR